MLLGRGRAKKGMFLGELEEGELEIGQISATIKEILPASEIIQNLMKEYDSTFEKMSKNAIKRTFLVLKCAKYSPNTMSHSLSHC